MIAVCLSCCHLFLMICIWFENWGTFYIYLSVWRRAEERRQLIMLSVKRKANPLLLREVMSFNSYNWLSCTIRLPTFECETLLWTALFKKKLKSTEIIDNYLRFQGLRSILEIKGIELKNFLVLFNFFHYSFERKNSLTDFISPTR